MIYKLFCLCYWRNRAYPAPRTAHLSVAARWGDQKPLFRTNQEHQLTLHHPEEDSWWKPGSAVQGHKSFEFLVTEPSEPKPCSWNLPGKALWLCPHSSSCTSQSPHHYSLVRVIPFFLLTFHLLKKIIKSIIPDMPFLHIPITAANVTVPYVISSSHM